MNPKSSKTGLKVLILALLASSTFSFAFVMTGTENRHCFRFRKGINGKSYRVVEFYYQSKSKKKNLQVQIHEELFSFDNVGTCKDLVKSRCYVLVKWDILGKWEGEANENYFEISLSEFA